jgi:hypothetical protein
MNVLSHMAARSSSVRRRLSNDAPLLDCILTGSAKIVREPVPLEESDDQSIPPKVLLTGLDIVARAVVQSKKAYLDHLYGKEGSFNREILNRDLCPAVEMVRDGKCSNWDPSDVEDLNDSFRLVTQVLFSDDLPRDKPVFRDLAANATALGRLPDTCDQCLLPPPDRIKLHRCSQCKVARYCPESFPRVAWKSGHRAKCWENKSGAD